MVKRILFLLILIPTMSLAAHITDKLLVGMYAKPNSDEQPIQLLPSGTPVDLKDEQNGFVNVELVDGTTGWVEKRFLSDEKPANVRLLALQSKYRQVQNKLDALEATAAETTAFAEKQQGAGADQRAVPAEFEQLQKSEQALKASLSKAQKTIQLLNKQLAQHQASAVSSNPSEGGMKKVSEEASSSIYAWLFAILMLALGLGAGVHKGMQIQDNRQRKKHGGFRI
ncbi:MAG: arylsulfatase [Cycloclasticus sp.]|nr:MAG: arylsulfatase [Cycloclasticus sp.]